MIDLFVHMDVTPLVALIQEAPWEDAGSCAVTPPENSFTGDERDFADSLFPFNLFILAVDAINSLSAEPQTPTLPAPFPGSETFDLHMLDSIAAAFRLLFSGLGIFGAGMMAYKLVSRSKEGD